MKKKIFKIIPIAFILIGCTNSKTISFSEAESKAQLAVSGEIISKHSDLDDNPPSYTFKIQNEQGIYELDVNATTGEILSQEKETSLNSNIPPQEEEVIVSHAITQEYAEKVAQDKVPGATILSVQLDHEYNHIACEYEIKMRNGQITYDIDVDAQSGGIVSYDEDYD